LSRFIIQLNSIGCKLCRPGYLEVLKQHYSDYTDHICPDCKVRLVKNPLRLLDCKKPACQEIAKTGPKIINYLCQECRLHFQSVQRYLGAMHIAFELNPRLVRGLDYYTRTVFEVEPRENGGQSTLGGGGRYDNLIEELGGRPTPAVGFATGLERIILNLKRQKLDIPALPGPDVFVAHLEGETKIEAMKLASELRKAGVAVIMATGDKSLRGQMRQADSLDIAYALILGEEEVSGQNVMLRDMRSGDQKSIPLAEIAAFFKQLRI
jgi:histidyl-tRNA synthetase